MTTTAVLGTVPERPAARPWTGWLRIVAGVLLGSFLLAGTAALVVGEEHSSLDRLEADLAAGRTSEVRLTDGLGPGGRGFSVVDVHWRTGLTGHVTQVVEARPLRAGNRPAGDLPAGTRVVRSSLADHLRAIEPTLEVRTVPEASFDSTYAGLAVPTWLALTGLLAMLATFVLLVAGPQPWRATRWAWFWLLGLLPPIGAMAFLVLGGPTGLSRPPRPTSYRLTGGWALLVVLVVGSAADTMLQVVV